DSIKNNIAMDAKLDDETIWKILDFVSIKEEVLEMPLQLNTQLGEWGINLSGGQKQRLTLARAIVRSPKILILDDCLSAVDTMTAEKILKNLAQNLKDTTLVWVAHRKSTLKYCDEIIELK